MSLPEPREGVWLAVSPVMVQPTQRHGRTIDDLLVTADPVRDARGQVIGCRALATLACSGPLSVRRVAHAPERWPPGQGAEIEEETMEYYVTAASQDERPSKVSATLPLSEGEADTLGRVADATRYSDEGQFSVEPVYLTTAPTRKPSGSYTVEVTYDPVWQDPQVWTQMDLDPVNVPVELSDEDLALLRRVSIALRTMAPEGPALALRQRGVKVPMVL